jgi:hypothetical protein
MFNGRLLPVFPTKRIIAPFGRCPSPILTKYMASVTRLTVYTSHSIFIFALKIVKLMIKISLRIATLFTGLDTSSSLLVGINEIIKYVLYHEKS